MWKLFIRFVVIVGNGLCPFFKLQHIPVKIRHKKSVLNDTVFFKFRLGVEFGCSRRTPPDGFAEQNGRDAEPSGLTASYQISAVLL